METLNASDSRRMPWNKRRLTGQKPPLKLREIWAIRTRLRMSSNARELALFNLAIDSKPSVSTIGEGRPIHADLDTPIRVLEDVEILVDQRAVLRRIVEHVNDPVVLNRQHLGHAPRHA
jgi:hypothetical protein